MADESVSRTAQFDAVSATLASQVRKACKNAGPDCPQAGTALRVEIDIAPTDPLDWLRAQDHPVKTFWADRDGAFRMAGVGEADKVPQDCEENLGDLISLIRGRLSPAHPNLRYYGGFSFSEHENRSQTWDSMGGFLFVLPRIELVVTAEETILACNLLWSGGWDLEEALRDLSRVRFPDTPAPASIPPLLDRSDRPDREAWDAITNGALERIAAGFLQKIVLARESSFTFSDPVDPCSLLMALAANTVHSYGFCFQLGCDHAFLGATPERLYKRQGAHLVSEALAGTRPRGGTPKADFALAEELSKDDKERREHTLVVDGIRRALEPLCHTVETDTAPEHLKLRDCQHLLSEIRGALIDPDSDAAILRALHPTPAVAGVPTKEAMEAIARLEPFSRGWYAGPVGWLGHDEAEFAVAIRSGLVTDRTLSLYAGAGIVDGSTPDREWDEIENKMSTFLRVLTDHGD